MAISRLSLKKLIIVVDSASCNFFVLKYYCFGHEMQLDGEAC